MDTMSAYMLGQVNRGREQKVFDWDKAAEIIRDKKPTWAVAGLEHDMEYTAGTIYDDGKPVKDDYTYLASTWATPILQLCIGNRIEEIPCYRMAGEVPSWNSETKWPSSALDILNKKETDQ